MLMVPKHKMLLTKAFPSHGARKNRRMRTEHLQLKPNIDRGSLIHCSKEHQSGMNVSFANKSQTIRTPREINKTSVERTQSLRTSERERIQTPTDESSMEGSGKINETRSAIPPSQYVSVSNDKTDLKKSGGKHSETPSWRSKCQYTEPRHIEIQKSMPSSPTRTQSLGTSERERVQTPTDESSMEASGKINETGSAIPPSQYVSVSNDKTDLKKSGGRHRKTPSWRSKCQYTEPRHIEIQKSMPSSPSRTQSLGTSERERIQTPTDESSMEGSGQINKTGSAIPPSQYVSLNNAKTDLSKSDDKHGETPALTSTFQYTVPRRTEIQKMRISSLTRTQSLRTSERERIQTPTDESSMEGSGQINKTGSAIPPSQYVSVSNAKTDLNKSDDKHSETPALTSTSQYTVPRHIEIQKSMPSSPTRTQSLGTSERERIQTPTDESSMEASGKINKTGSAISPSQYVSVSIAKTDLNKSDGKHGETPALTSKCQYTVPRHTEIQKMRMSSLTRTQSLRTSERERIQTPTDECSMEASGQINKTGSAIPPSQYVSVSNAKTDLNKSDGKHGETPALTSTSQYTVPRRTEIAKSRPSCPTRTQSLRTSERERIQTPTDESSMEASGQINKTGSAIPPSQYVSVSNAKTDLSKSDDKHGETPALTSTSQYTVPRRTEIQKSMPSSPTRTQSLGTSERERIQTPTDESNMEASGKTNKAWSAIPPSQYVSVSNAKTDLNKSGGKHGKTPAWRSKCQYTVPRHIEIQKSMPSSPTRTQSLGTSERERIQTPTDESSMETSGKINKTGSAISPSQYVSVSNAKTDLNKSDGKHGETPALTSKCQYTVPRHTEIQKMRMSSLTRTQSLGTSERERIQTPTDECSMEGSGKINKTGSAIPTSQYVSVSNAKTDLNKSDDKHGETPALTSTSQYTVPRRTEIQKSMPSSPTRTQSLGTSERERIQTPTDESSMEASGKINKTGSTISPSQYVSVSNAKTDLNKSDGKHGETPALTSTSQYTVPRRTEIAKSRPSSPTRTQSLGTSERERIQTPTDESSMETSGKINKTGSAISPSQYVSVSNAKTDLNKSDGKHGETPALTSKCQYTVPRHTEIQKMRMSSLTRTQSLRTSERERIQTPTDESSMEGSGKINKTGSAIPTSQYVSVSNAKTDLNKSDDKHGETPALTSTSQYTVPRRTEIQKSMPSSPTRTQSLRTSERERIQTPTDESSMKASGKTNKAWSAISPSQYVSVSNAKTDLNKSDGKHGETPALTSKCQYTVPRHTEIQKMRMSSLTRTQSLRTSERERIQTPTDESSMEASGKTNKAWSAISPSQYVSVSNAKTDLNKSDGKHGETPALTSKCQYTVPRHTEIQKMRMSSLTRTQSLRTSERERIQTPTDESSMEGSGKTNKAWSEIPPSQYVYLNNSKADISKSDGKHGDTPALTSKRPHTEPRHTEIQKLRPITFQRTKHVMACPLLMEENNFQRKESSDVKRTTIKQSRPGARSDSRAKTQSHSQKSHKDRLMGVLNVKRFSEVEVISMSFPQSLTIGDLRYNIQLHYKVTDNTEILLYQNFRQLQADRMVVKEIEVTDEPANILVCVSSKERRLLDGLVTDKPDMINPWDDDDRYLMSCGHAITPDNLHAYCWSELQRNKAELRCPAITNSSTEKCKVIWKFSDIVNGACLSVDEMNLFSSYLNKNWLDSTTRIQLCPSCGEAINKSSCNKDLMECLYCKRSGEKMWRFCFKCLQQWLNSYSGTKCGNRGCETNAERMRDILQTCSRKTIIGVAGCPCIRACPKCQYVLEHTSESNDSCKHMVCAACDTKFCFICLKVKTDTLYWPCGGAYEQCNVAPVQLL